MTQQELFAAALGLDSPWKIEKILFSMAKKRLDIHIDFERGGLLPCPTCATLCKAYDTTEDSWRHLNFFQHSALLHARVPRVDCDKCHAIRKAAVPWARTGSGFTLLFEALVMALCQEMPVLAVADLIGEHDTRIWRVLHHYVKDAVAARDLSDVKTIGVDETASRRGHRYVTFFFDLDRKRLLFGTTGKDASTVESFSKDLQAHKGTPSQIKRVACDMSAAFIKGIRDHLSHAEITFNRFHLTKIVNEAVDQVRREEVATCEDLKKTRFLWLTNPSGLSRAQRGRIFQSLLPKPQNRPCLSDPPGIPGFLQQAERRKGRGFPETMVLLGNALPVAAYHSSCQNDQGSLEWSSQLVFSPYYHRTSGGI